jgi:hypothetical protein
MRQNLVNLESDLRCGLHPALSQKAGDQLWHEGFTQRVALLAYLWICKRSQPGRMCVLSGRHRGQRAARG